MTPPPIREPNLERLIELLQELDREQREALYASVIDDDDGPWVTWFRERDEIERALGYVPGSLFPD